MSVGETPNGRTKLDHFGEGDAATANGTSLHADSRGALGGADQAANGKLRGRRPSSWNLLARPSRRRISGRVEEPVEGDESDRQTRGKTPRARHYWVDRQRLRDKVFLSAFLGRDEFPGDLTDQVEKDHDLWQASAEAFLRSEADKAQADIDAIDQRIKKQPAAKKRADQGVRKARNVVRKTRTALEETRDRFNQVVADIQAARPSYPAWAVARRMEERRKLLAEVDAAPTDDARPTDVPDPQDEAHGREASVAMNGSRAIPRWIAIAVSVAGSAGLLAAGWLTGRVDGGGAATAGAVLPHALAVVAATMLAYGLFHLPRSYVRTDLIRSAAKRKRARERLRAIRAVDRALEEQWSAAALGQPASGWARGAPGWTARLPARRRGAPRDAGDFVLLRGDCLFSPDIAEEVTVLKRKMEASARELERVEQRLADAKSRRNEEGKALKRLQRDRERVLEWKRDLERGMHDLPRRIGWHKRDAAMEVQLARLAGRAAAARPGGNALEES